MKKDELLVEVLEKIISLYPWAIGDSPLPTSISSRFRGKDLSLILQALGLGGFIYYYLTVSNKSSSSTLKEKLTHSYLQNLYRNIILLKEWEKIKSILNEIELFPIKGIYLLESVYTDYGLRKLSDIDLMISPELRFEIYDRLCNSGYIPLYKKEIACMPFMKHLSFYSQNDKVHLEIHHALNLTYSGNSNELPLLITEEKIDKNHLTNNAQFYILLTHAFSHAITLISNPAYLIDLLYILGKYEIDIKRVFRISSLSGTEHITKLGSYFLYKNFNLSSISTENLSPLELTIFKILNQFFLFKFPSLAYKRNSFRIITLTNIVTNHNKPLSQKMKVILAQLYRKIILSKHPLVRKRN